MAGGSPHVTILVSDVADTAVAMFAVVPVNEVPLNEIGEPSACMINITESARVTGAILERLEQRLAERIIVADSRSRV